MRHRRLIAALLDPRVWALGVVYLGYAISYYGVQLWLPQIVQAMGFSNLATGFLVALPFAATMIAMFLWGRSSDRKRRAHLACRGARACRDGRPYYRKPRRRPIS